MSKFDGSRTRIRAFRSRYSMAGIWISLLCLLLPGAAWALGTVPAPQALVVVDGGVADPDILLSDLEGARVLYLEPGSSPFAAIAGALQQMGGADSLHLVSHGADGALLLGGFAVDQRALEREADALQTIGRMLGEHGDILLYGCSVAEAAAGRALVDRLSGLTGTAVAASTNLTGSTAAGGDWNLEYRAGAVTAGIAFSAAAQAAYPHVLTHGRGGSITWQTRDLDDDGLKNDVEITVRSGWRASQVDAPGLQSAPSLGPLVTVSNDVLYVNGEGATADYAIRTQIFHARDLDPDTRYLVSFQVCCRISNLVNNADAQGRVEAEIFIQDGNLAPKVDLPIIFQVPQRDADNQPLANWTFRMQSSDPNADKLRYRLATPAEFGGGGQTSPAGLSINPNTGLITWTGSGGLPQGLYSAGFVAEDLDESGQRKSKTHVDLILDLVDRRQTQFEVPGLPETRNVFVRKGESYDLVLEGEGATVIDTEALGTLQNTLTEVAPNEFRFEPGAPGGGLDPGSYPVTFEIRGTGGAGTSNNYLVVNFIVPDDMAPWVDNLEGIRTVYATNQLQLVGDPGALPTLTYTRNPTLNGGRLRLNVRFVDGTYEVLDVLAEGNGAGQIDRIGDEIFYEGNLIGLVDGTLNGQGRALQIDFTTADATVAAVEALLQRLAYRDTFTLRQPGDRGLSLFLRDQDGRSNSYDFFIDVQPQPDAPDSGPPLEASNRLTSVEGQTAVLSDEDINFVDPQGRPVTLTVTSIERGRFEYLSAPGVAITSFTQNELVLGAIAFAYVSDGSRLAPGYTLTATAGDDTSEPSPGVVTFTNLNLNAPTIVGTPPGFAVAGAAYSFQPVAGDDDLGFGDELTFTIAGMPDWANFDPQTGRLSGTPQAGDVASYGGIVIGVRDAAGATASLPPFPILVLPPVAAGDTATFPVLEGTIVIGEIAVSGSGDLTYFIVPGSDSALFDIDPATGELTFRAGAEPGSYSVLVSAENADGDISAPVLVTIHVAGGDGTRLNPIVITTPEQMLLLAEFPDAHFVIANDLDLTDIDWTPVGTDDVPFTGSVRGQGGNAQTLTGLGGEPLFGVIGPGAVISDLIIAGSTIDKPEQDGVGILANRISGDALNPVVITNVSIVGGSVNGANDVGGVAGSIEHAILTDVSIDATVNGTGNRVGGIAGSSSATTYENVTGGATEPPVVTLFDADGNPLPAGPVPTGAEIRIRVTGAVTPITVSGTVARGGDEDTLNGGTGDVVLVDPDGNGIVLTQRDGDYYFSATRGGDYEIRFRDAASVVFRVQFEVRPQVAFGSVRQFGTAGMPLMLRAVLEGTPAQYPVRVAYQVTGHSRLDSSDLAASGDFLFEAGGPAERVRLLSLTPNTATGDVTVELLRGDSAEHALPGNPSSHRIVLLPQAAIPLGARLRVEQDGQRVDVIRRDAGPVTVSAISSASGAAFAGGGFALDWAGSSAALQLDTESAAVLTLDPAIFDGGSGYRLQVEVEELDGARRTALAEARLRVVENDTDDRWVQAQSFQSASTPNRLAICPQGDTVFRGNGDRACNQVDRSEQGVYLEVPEGYRLSLGRMSEQASWTTGEFGLELEVDEFRDANGELLADAQDTEYQHIGYRVDFEIHDLDFPGQSIPAVIPLPVGVSIPEDAAWRKFIDGGWVTFTENAGNLIHSAARSEDGQCPWVGSDRWSAGLTTGHGCVRLVIEDGGPNDLDGRADGTVRDPGSLGEPVGPDDEPGLEPGPEPAPVVTRGRSGGGGSLDALTLVALALFTLFAVRRRRPATTPTGTPTATPVAALMSAVLLMPVLLAPLPARAETTESTDWRSLVERNWYVGGSLLQARSDRGSSGIDRALAQQGIDGFSSVQDSSRLAWRLTGGLTLTQHVSIEAGYVDLGEVSTRFVHVQPLTLAPLQSALPAGGWGIEIAPVLRYGIGERLEVFGRAGLWRWQAEYRLRGFVEGPRSDDENGVSALFGAGALYRVSDRWALTFAVDRYRLDGDDVDLVGIGFGYRR